MALPRVCGPPRPTSVFRLLNSPTHSDPSSRRLGFPCHLDVNHSSRCAVSLSVAATAGLPLSPFLSPSFPALTKSSASRSANARHVGTLGSSVHSREIHFSHCSRSHTCARPPPPAAGDTRGTGPRKARERKTESTQTAVDSLHVPKTTLN